MNFSPRSRAVGHKGSLTARAEFPSPRLSPRLQGNGKVEWSRSHTLLKSKQRYAGSRSNSLSQEQYQSHEFSFDAVFRNPDTKQLFHSFLVLSQNEDPFIFYDQVSLFKATGSAKIAQAIYKSYIQERAIHEVNLGQQLRLTIIGRYEECVEKKLLFPIDLFDSAQKSVYLELKHDPFQRFIASSIFAQFVNARDEEFLNSLRIPEEFPSATHLMLREMSPRARKFSLTGTTATISPTAPTPPSYGSEEPVITDPDVYFRTLSTKRDSSTFTRSDVMFWFTFMNPSEEWTPFYQDQKLKLNCFSRNSSVKNYKVMKSMYVMPYPIKTVLYALTSDRRYTFPTVHSESSTSVTAMETCKLPFPYQDREFVTCNSLFHMEKFNRFVLLQKSLEQGVYQDEIKTTRNTVRGHMLLGGWILERGVNDISTTVTVCKVVNMGGFIKGDGTWRKMFTHLCKNEVLSILKDMSVWADHDHESDPKMISTLKILS
jgi:hypothetical protein